MGLTKRCIDILEHSKDPDEKYEAASFMIRSSVDHRGLKGHERKETFSSLIHEYCFRYNLKPKKLGKYVGDPSLIPD